MKIGIDIDGVLNSHYDFSITYGFKYCSEIGKYQLENINAFDTTDIFGWTDEIAHDFWNKYRKDLVSELPAREFASEVISKLRNLGDEIYIITARKNYDEWFPKELQSKVEEITKKWLKENKIIYDDIFFNIKDKGTHCKEHNIDIMIEDETKNIKKLINNTSIIIYDAPYNRIPEFNNLTRCYSWYDIYNKINRRREKNAFSNYGKI